MAKSLKSYQQAEFAFPEHGGAREGAGRKRAGPKAKVSHTKRTKLLARHPVHVTLRVETGLPSLREGHADGVVFAALIAGAVNEGFRLIQYSVQSNHVHLICETDGRDALSRGIQGLKVSMARRLNRLWKRTGRVFADRYHDWPLKSPREMHNALQYVFENSSHHGSRHSSGIDPCSSARWFHGERPSPLPQAQTWLGSVGWQRWGPIEVV